VSAISAEPAPDLSVDLAPGHRSGLRLDPPVLTASGTFGFGDEYLGVVDYARLGAIITKTVTPAARDGNPTPRTVETPAGMLNSIGLPNAGGASVIRQKRDLWRDLPCPVIVSLAAPDAESWTALAAAFEGLPNVVALEANLSCPNVAGLDFAADPSATGVMLRAVVRGTSLPIIAKLSPNVTDIQPVARAAEDAGAHAISLINTVLGMVIDVERRRPFLGNRVGGVSGPAIRAIAVRCVYQAFETVRVPLIGIGGIATAEDALQFILAGATTVQVGTATFRNPQAPVEVADGLRAHLRRHGLPSLLSLVGAAHRADG